MRSRIRVIGLLVGAGLLVGGGIAIASAANGSGSPSTSTANTARPDDHVVAGDMGAASASAGTIDFSA